MDSRTRGSCVSPLRGYVFKYTWGWRFHVGLDLLHDESIMRFLRARDGVKEKALAALQETVQWRSSERPHFFRSTHSLFRSQVVTGKNYLHGHDKEGNPIMVMRLQRDTDPSTCPEKLLFMIFNMERARRRVHATNARGAVWIVDIGSFHMGWMAPARMKLGTDLSACSCYVVNFSVVIVLYIHAKIVFVSPFSFFSLFGAIFRTFIVCYMVFDANPKLVHL